MTVKEFLILSEVASNVTELLEQIKKNKDMRIKYVIQLRSNMKRLLNKNQKAILF